MRITINNPDNITMSNVANAVFDMERDILDEHKHYKAVYNSKNVEVFYRKTKNGYAIDLHKIKK